MSSMVSLKNFTIIFTVFCILVFSYFFIPDTYGLLNSIIKVIIMVLSIIILMIYYKKIEDLSFEKMTQMDKTNSHDNLEIELTRDDAKKQYARLTNLVLETTKSINLNSSSAIYMIDPSKDAYILQAGDVNDFADSISARNITINKFLSNNKKLNQKDHPDIWSEIFFGKNWKGSECALFSQISLHEKVAGFILTNTNHFTDVNEKNIKLFNQLGQFVSSGLENLDSLEKHIIGEDSKSLILEILSNLDFKSDGQNIFNQFKYLVRTFFHYDRATISIRVESEDRRKYDKGVNSIIKLVDGHKDDFIEGATFPTNGSLHGLPVITGNPFQTVNWGKTYQNIARFNASESDDHKFKSVIGVPIIIQSESRGSIILERYDEKLFSKMEFKDLVLIGHVLGSALNWRYEYKKIHTNATHDGLSGLLNHQTFKERFNDEIQRAARFQQKMAVMIFDLDKFKKVNDTLGHQYGDYVIQTVAKIMQDNVRAIDVVARYGGEEFAIILINTTALMSNIVAQRIVENIADYDFSLDGVNTRLTISGGMSEYPTHSQTTKELIEIADQAMYSTKERGGDGITIAKNVNDNG